MESFSYELGRMWGRTSSRAKVVAGVVLATAVAVGALYNNWVARAEESALHARLQAEAAQRRTAAAQAAREADADKAGCIAKREAHLAAARAAMVARKYTQAADALRVCAEKTGDPALNKALVAADIADLKDTAADARQTVGARIVALDVLQRNHPDAFKGQEALYARLNKTKAAEEAAEKRRHGVSLGMSREDVLASSWGRPDRINKSHTVNGTTEQWVYEGASGKRGYLNFVNGVLVVVQN